jgi:hypothetical protein
MRSLKRVISASALAVLVMAGGAATAAAASAQPHATSTAKVRLHGGHTSVTTGKGIATALLGSGIVPLATAPGSQTLRSLASGPAAEFSFPVTGGRVSLSPLAGNIDHDGGIFFYNTKNGKDIEVSNFIISLRQADLTGIVNGNPKARVVIFWLHLAHARLSVHGHQVTASRIGVSLSATAASALDAALGTTIFTPGLKVGTARTTLRV